MWRSSLSRTLVRCRLFLDNEARSQGVKNFVNANYNEIKSLNPSFDFMVRHCNDDDPVALHAELNDGREVMVDLSNASEETVGKALETIVEKGFDVNSEMDLYTRPYERVSVDPSIEKMIVDA